MLGFEKLPVRFFIYDCADDGTGDSGDIRECSEADFIDCDYPLFYKRHTVFENGVSQICLTKMPQG